MRKVKITKKTLQLSEEVETLIEKKVTRFGNGAKVDCPKKYLGKRAYLIICKD